MGGLRRPFLESMAEQTVSPLPMPVPWELVGGSVLGILGAPYPSSGIFFNVKKKIALRYDI